MSNRPVRPTSEPLERRLLWSVSMLADLTSATRSAAYKNGSTVFGLGLTRSGGVTYFNADDGVHGQELWRTDGTAAGTRLVRDVDPAAAVVNNNGSTHLGPQNTTDVNGTLYYTQDTTATGTELYRSDGTADGTVLVADLVAGAGSSSPTKLTNVNGTLFFFSGTTLYKTDGTAAGTTAVKSFAGGVYPYGLGGTPVAVGGGRLLFAVVNTDPNTAGSIPSGTWVSDGTAAGTKRLTDAAGNDLGTHAAAGPVVTLNGQSYYGGYDGLVRTDGTPAGTAALYAGSVTGVAAVGGSLYFLRTDYAAGTVGLYQSDGTTAGTALVRQLNDVIATYSNAPLADNLTVLGSRLVFESTASPTAGPAKGGPALWASDGTAAGTVPLAKAAGRADRAGGQVAVAGGRAYFVGVTTDANSVGQPSLWSTDGTTATAVAGAPVGGLSNALLVGQTGDGELSAAADGRLLFAAADAAAGLELWATDGTVAGTARVRDVNATTGDSLLSNFTTFGGRAIFAANHTLYASDGTAAGTVALHTWAGNNTTIGYGYAATASTLYFVAPNKNAPANNYTLALWRTDGTAAGTVQLNTSGVAPQSGTGLAVFDGRVYYIADPAYFGGNTHPLIATDGTAAGTDVVSPAGVDAAYNAAQATPMVVAGNRLYFMAAPPNSTSFGLYVTDGPAAAATQVPTGTSLVASLATAGGVAYYSADGPGGQAAPAGLWRTDGTAAGTVRVSPYRPVFLSAAGSMTDVAGRLFYFADDAVHGTEPWASDGTAAGTALVADLVPGPGSSYPAEAIVRLGNRAAFYAHNSAGAVNPYVSDGTAAGTVRLADVTGLTTPATNRLVVANGQAYFAQASTGTPGALTVSDGTPAGTRTVVRSALPADYGLAPRLAVTAAGVAVFANVDVAHGTEPWTYVPGGPATVAGTAGDDTFAVASAGTTVNVWADVPLPGQGTPSLQLLADDTPTVTVVGGGGSDTLAVSGPVRVVVGGEANPTLATLVLGGTGARVDIADRDVTVAGGTLADLTRAAATAFAGGTWAGPGLTSQLAAADANHLTAVGVAATAAGVRARSTLYGDTNLDGRVDAADYTRIDAGFLLRHTGWADGDLNYDGVVDASDYTLMDNAFNHQPTAAPPATVVAATPGRPAEPPTAVVPDVVDHARRKRTNAWWAAR